MEQIGNKLIEVGLTLMPYSFAIYFPYRFLEYKWQMGYSNIIKAIWYLALGIGYVTNGYGIDLVVVYICFIEAWDLFIHHFEIQYKRNLQIN